MVAMTRLSFTAAIALLVSASSALPALAEELTVDADQSQIISLPRPASTVVVGNPSIADVTLQGNQIFVHGRLFGKTNVIALDEQGNQLADYAVNVVTDDDYTVVVFKPTASQAGGPKQSFTCKTDCEAVYHVGDDEGTVKVMNEQQNNKLKLAEGRKSGESGGDTNQSPSP